MGKINPEIPVVYSHCKGPAWIYNNVNLRVILKQIQKQGRKLSMKKCITEHLPSLWHCKPAINLIN